MSQVQCLHLLVKHTGSRNPVSRRTNAAATYSIDEARNHLQTLIDTPITRENFAQLAQANSDCSSFRNGGDLGVFGRGMMQRPFEEAAFDLDIGNISGIVTTDSGLHVIYRVA